MELLLRADHGTVKSRTHSGFGPLLEIGTCGRQIWIVIFALATVVLVLNPFLNK
jgi:hypothetical protein